MAPNDTVVDELNHIAEQQNGGREDMALAMAIYMLGFGSYIGFDGRQ